MTHHMRTKCLFTAVVLAACLYSSVVSAESFWSQFVDPDDKRFDASNFLADNAYGFLPVPIIITDPAVDGGLGMVGLFFHESDEEKERRLEALRTSDQGARFLIPPSVSAAAVAATGNDSWFAGGGHMGFFKQGRIRYMVGGGYGDVNLDFFGFGNVTLNNPIELNTQAAALMQSIKFRIGDRPFFVGAVQNLVGAQIKPNSLGDLGGDFLPPEYQEEFQEIIRRLLTQDVTTSGLGMVLEFDSRDNIFSPKGGYRYTLEHLWFRDFLGSDVEYQLTSFDALNYWRLSKKFRAGMRLSAEHADTDGLLPPFATPSIALRGVPAMRYQGNAVAVAEAELAWQIDARWSMLGFVGAGRATNSFGDLGSAASRVSKGAGFRYLIAKRYGFDMGLDVARGPEETVWYIQAGSAW